MPSTPADTFKAKYDKWAAIDSGSDSDDEPEVKGAVKERGEYEVVETLVYVLDKPDEKANMINCLERAHKVETDRRFGNFVRLTNPVKLDAKASVHTTCLKVRLSSC